MLARNGKSLSCILYEDPGNSLLQRQFRYAYILLRTEALDEIVLLYFRSSHYDLKPSLMLWLLALIGGAFDDGRIPVLGFELCLTFETA
jgi:hypothetical protein